MDIFITKLQKKILKLCNASPSKINHDTLSPLFLKYSEDDVIKAFEALVKDGFFSSHLLVQDDMLWRAELSHKGKRYLELERIRLRRFLLQSIATPIFVSFITALITLWLKGLL